MSVDLAHRAYYFAHQRFHRLSSEEHYTHLKPVSLVCKIFEVGGVRRSSVRTISQNFRAEF